MTSFEQRKAELKEANAAVREIRFYAVDMLRAQGRQLEPGHRAILVRQADALRALLETDELQRLCVRVYDIYSQDVLIGHMEYQL